MSVWLDLLTSVALEFIKQILSALPKSLDAWRFRRFFGPSATRGAGVFAVLDPYRHPLPRVGNRYIKHFLNRRPDQPLVGEDQVLGVNAVRVVAYLSSAFSQYRRGGSTIPIVTDEQVEANWDGTFLSFGSSDSNIKTFDIERLPQQHFYTFEFGPDGTRRFSVAGRSYQPRNRHDYAVLMRLRNPYHAEHFIFVCAGLGEWGTSGSAYYLFHRWKELFAKHRQRDFCIIIEVDIGSDESAREVITVAQ